MSKVITAIFNSDQVANSAASALRQTPEGIINMNLSSAKQHTLYQSGFTNTVAPLAGDYTQLYTPQFHSCVSYSQMVLRVSCRDEVESELVNRLSASGAEKITVQ